MGNWQKVPLWLLLRINSHRLARSGGLLAMTRVRAGQPRHRRRVGRPVRLSRGLLRRPRLRYPALGRRVLAVGPVQAQRTERPAPGHRKSHLKLPLDPVCAARPVPHQALAAGPVPAARAGTRLPHGRRRKHPEDSTVLKPIPKVSRQLLSDRTFGHHTGRRRTRATFPNRGDRAAPRPSPWPAR